MKKITTLFILFFCFILNAQTQITDANFQTAVNTCLSTNPVDGMCSDSEYGAMDDMVWYKNISSVFTGDDDITEILEHTLHTLHMFGVRGAVSGSADALNPNSAQSELSLAMFEAIDNGVFNVDGYGGAPYTVKLKEYQYLLTFSMWGFGKEFWQNSSLAPEWNDNSLNAQDVLKNNPLGYALFNKYYAPVVSKPNITELRTMFQDNDGGVSGYVAD